MRRMGVRVGQVAAAAGMAALLSGCTGQASPAPPTPGLTASTPTTGTLSGTARMYGGPVNPTTHQASMTGQPARGVVVPVRAGSKVVATGMTGEGGQFSISLTPGRYTLACGTGESFTIVVGQTLSLDCDLVVA